MMLEISSLNLLYIELEKITEIYKCIQSKKCHTSENGYL